MNTDINWQNIYYTLQESDRCVERIQEIAEKMSKVSGLPVGGFIENSDSLCTDLDWPYVVCALKVELCTGSLSKNSEITEQQLDERIKEMETLSNTLSSELEDTDMENTKTKLEELCEQVTEDNKHEELLISGVPTCCKGGSITNFCKDVDDCTGSLGEYSYLTEEQVDFLNDRLGEPVLEDVTTWKCFKEVADVLGEEDAEYELKRVLYKHLDGCEVLDLDTSEGLLDAFWWKHSPQGEDYWNTIEWGNAPKDPVKPSPTLKIPDSVVSDIKETFEEDVKELSVGSLTEKLHQKLPPSTLQITVSGDGSVLLHGEGLPVVDVSKLEAEDIDKAVEALVMLQGCFVEYNQEGEV